jgi:serine/threonine protein phosphatase PrpC
MRRNMGDDRRPGCTALAALLLGDALFIANAGDCRAVLCRGGRALPLSRDHTADLPGERARILSVKGRLVYRIDSWRVGDAGLQVTRSIGDGDVKPHGVIAAPELRALRLGPSDAFLLLASDGVWDVIAPEEAVGLVLDTVKQPELAAKRLATEALARGSADNVTCVVAFLQPVATLERIFGGGAAARAATRTHFGSRGVFGGSAASAGGGASADELRDGY